MRLEPDIDNKKTNLSKAELKELVSKKKENIKKLISQVKHCKNITLSLAITGEYMISTKMKRLTPRSQENIDHWHYSHSIKVDEATAKKNTVVHIIATKLIEGLNDHIDRTTWYIGLDAIAA